MIIIIPFRFPRSQIKYFPCFLRFTIPQQSQWTKRIELRNAKAYKQTFMRENQKNMFHLLEKVNHRRCERKRERAYTQKNKSIIALKRETLFIRCVRLFIFTLSSSSSSSLSPIWFHSALFETVRAKRASRGKGRERGAKSE